MLCHRTEVRNQVVAVCESLTIDLLERAAKKIVRHFDHLVEPDLSDEKTMRCVRDDGETGRDAELLHLLSQVVCARARVVFFTGDQPTRRIRLVEVTQWGCEAIDLRLVLL